MFPGTCIRLKQSFAFALTCSFQLTLTGCVSQSERAASGQKQPFDVSKKTDKIQPAITPSQ